MVVPCQMGLKFGTNMKKKKKKKKRKHTGRLKKTSKHQDRKLETMSWKLRMYNKINEKNK